MINLSNSFKMPREAITETFGIVAKRGSGKTYSAKVMVEEMLQAQAHVVVLDPVGVWWGLRTGADGKSGGFPILIAGGERGDLPLETTAGSVMADLVIEGHSAVLDLSLMRKGEQRRFATDFLERLYHKNRAALHLVLEEADMFAPQRPVKGSERLLGAAEDIVRRGRSRGIGVTMITQRPAVIHKDVLTQVETLIALRLTGPQDRKAIDAWVEHHGDQELRKELMSALPSLPIGEAIIWSPGWLGAFERIKVRQLKTFDSSKTPKPGSREASTRTVAAVDIDALNEQIAATVERAAENDPKRLKARIAELEAALRKAEAHTPAPEVVEISVLTDEDQEALSAMTETLADLGEALKSASVLLPAAIQAVESIAARTTSRQPPPARPFPRASAPLAQINSVSPAGPAQPQTVDGLDGPESRILNGLAWLVDTTGNNQQPEAAVAFMANYKVGGGAFNNPKARLKRKGLIEYGAGKTIILTEDGNATAQHKPGAATPQDLHARVFSVIDGPMQRLLQPLLEVYPGPMHNDELADAAGYSPGGGAFNNPRGRLKTCGLVEYPAPGYVRASPILFFDTV